MIWRLMKDFKYDIMFSAFVDYDIDTYYIYYTPHAWICRKFVTNVPHIHNIASQTLSKFDFETFQNLQLRNIVIITKQQKCSITYYNVAVLRGNAKHRSVIGRLGVMFNVRNGTYLVLTEFLHNIYVRLNLRPPFPSAHLTCSVCQAMCVIVDKNKCIKQLALVTIIFSNPLRVGFIQLGPSSNTKGTSKIKQPY